MSIYYNEGFVRENIDTECSFVIPDSEPARMTSPQPPIEVKQLDAVPLEVNAVARIDGMRSYRR